MAHHIKTTCTAESLRKGDKIGNRVVRYATLSDTGAAFLVYFEDSETPERYGRNEPITVTPVEVSD